MSEITVYGFAPSTYTRTVRMAAIEKGVEHELKPVAMGEPEHFMLHPFGKMPIMAHGDVIIFETLGILSYIDSAFDGPNLFQDHLVERARTLSVISAAIDYAYRPVVHSKMSQGRLDSEAMKAVSGVFDWLENLTASNAYLCGSSISAADLFILPMLAHHIKEAGDEHVISGRPTLENWFTKASKRESFLETG